MALIRDLQQLQDRALADLNAAHDYYADTKVAWTFVRRGIATGQTLILDRATGAKATGAEFVTKTHGYVREQLAEATFQQFVSVFEAYLIDLIRLWLTAHPKSLSRKDVPFKLVLEAADKDAVIAGVVDRELNRLTYEKPADWFAYLDELVKLGCPSPAQIGRVAEAKATRDLLVHNRGVVNLTYLMKAGDQARHGQGERIEAPEPYHRQVWELFRDIVTAMSAAAIAKAG